MGRRAARRRAPTTRQPPATPTPTASAPTPATPPPAVPSSTPGRAPAGPDEVSLDRLGDLVTARALIDAEVAHLVDALAAAGTSWPAIAGVLGVSRQAARQAHHRRTGRRSSPAAGSSP